jgi:hypothetical protein
MSTEYTSSPSPAIRHQRLLGFGTAHAGPEWSAAVRALRAAISAAKVVAPHRTKPTEDEIAEAVIDHVGTSTHAIAWSLPPFSGFSSARRTEIRPLLPSPPRVGRRLSPLSGMLQCLAAPNTAPLPSSSA